MRVYILRGIPGSGKSTLASEMESEMEKEGLSNPHVCSADHFFTSDGVYKFDHIKLAEAHKSCQVSFLEKLQRGCQNIIVDNTNIHSWEIAYYYCLAKVYMANTQIITCYCPPEIAFRRGTHAVPFAQVLRMHQALMNESLPPFWKHRVIDRTYPEHPPSSQPL